MKAALFLDRDGTIIVDRHYPGDPEEVELLPGAAAAIRAANARAMPVVVITNQSGIGRGLITIEQYHAVHQRMVTLLEQDGAHIDASYHCPHWPEQDGSCECRKPGLALYTQAATEHDIDLSQSAFVGDRWRDVEPGVRSGGLAVLVPGPNTSGDDVVRAQREARVLPSLESAVAAMFERVDSARPDPSASLHLPPEPH